MSRWNNYNCRSIQYRAPLAERPTLRNFMNGYGNSLKPYKADSRTTEIRMLEGTLSPFKTKDWVTILLGLFEYSQEIPIPEINIPYDPVYWADFMLDSIVARYTRSKGLWDRLRKYRSQADKWGFDHGGNPVQ